MFTVRGCQKFVEAEYIHSSHICLIVRCSVLRLFIAAAVISLCVPLGVHK